MLTRFFVVLLLSLLIPTTSRAGDQPRMIEVSEVVAGPISEVWTAWTTSGGTPAFFGAQSKIELRPGGPYEIYFSMEAPEGSRGSEGCTVLSFLPERMLSFSWNAPPKFQSIRDNGPRTIVVVDFERVDAAHTRVSLHHHGWPDAAHSNADWDGLFEYFSKAWPRVLGGLKEHFAAAGASAAGASGDPGQGYAIFLHPVRDTFPGDATPEERKLVAEHFERLKALMAAGKIIVAGPCTDNVPLGIIVADVRDEAEARRILEEDPAVKGKVMTGEVRPMRLALVRGRD